MDHTQRSTDQWRNQNQDPFRRHDKGMEAFVTNPAGSFSAVVPGGGGPATLYIQALILDGNLPQGVAFSNALALEFLP